LIQNAPVSVRREEHPMKRTVCLLALATTVLAVLPESADAHGRRGRWWGGVSIGIGVPLYGAYAYPGYYGHPGYVAYPYGYPGYVVSTLPPVAYEPVPAAPPAPAAPDPIFYPNRGQSAAKAEADRQACNRWAMTQRDAVADASVFHRATLACMEGRGYTVR
jgi:uncharacterized membrane protein